MAVDATLPDSPGWWLIRLGKKLEALAPEYDRLDRYARGLHPLPEGNEKYRKAYQRLQAKARSNYAGLVVEALRERLRVTGFRTGSETTSDIDGEAWKVWQQNHLDADQALVHRAALAMGVAYVIVGRNRITPEDPRKVVHESDPEDRRNLRAALKVWHDDLDNRRHAVLYRPDAIDYFVASKSGREIRWQPAQWDVESSAGNPLRSVPVVPFVNKPDMFGYGMGEFEDVCDIQDRINNTLLDRLVITKMQAFRQRWMTGVSMTDADGNPREMEPGSDIVWAVDDPDARFGDFEAADIGGILKAVESDVRDLAAITRTPPHYLLGQMVNVSGDALKAAETGLVSKAHDRMAEFGESWEQVNRFKAIYDKRNVADDAEVIWADPESRSLAELADAAVKKKTVGVPWAQLMRDLNYSPQEINRMESERTTDALLNPIPPPPIPGQPVAPNGQQPPPGPTVTNAAAG